MDEQQNTKLIQDCYSAFLRGDIPAVLGMMSDDMDFYVPGDGAFPTAGHRRGLAEMQEFFRTLNDSVRFDAFEPLNFVAQGDLVVVLGRYTGTAKPTGRNFTMEWAMAWTVRQGKIVKFQEYTDTLAGARAFQMEGASATV